MFYNFSEFLTQVKEDIGIKDLPLPVDDIELTKRFNTSALREFSVRYPKISEAWVTTSDALDLSHRNLDGSVCYTIPYKYYAGTQILYVISINSSGYGAGSNMYMPNVILGSGDMVIESIADIKMAAAIGSMMCHAPTFRFDYPDKLWIYNGWTAGSYRVELALMHDPSLSTIPPSAMTHLRQLAVLDTEEFLYNKLKRIDELDVGVGNIKLKIENWENAAQEKRDLLKEWDEYVNLDIDTINYF